MMKCVEFLIKSARKMRKKAENSGIGAKFHSFISSFQSYPLAICLALDEPTLEGNPHYADFQQLFYTFDVVAAGAVQIAAQPSGFWSFKT